MPPLFRVAEWVAFLAFLTAANANANNGRYARNYLSNNTHYDRYARNHQELPQSQRPLTPGGPNVCRVSNRMQCCPGWQRDHILGFCITPVCSRSCGRGKCVQPNICLCEGGRKSSSCAYKRGPGSCRAICMNGGTCVEGKCTCAPGYTGEFCTEPICLDPCKNGGRCIGPDRCACMYGFAGSHCEVDYRTGPCYSGVRGALCVNQLEGVVCTKTLCCATVGKAWGHPCEHCPSRLECETGYLKNQKTGECVDINECEAIPHLCTGGQCVNTPGSFDCVCGPGQARNPDTNKCDDRNECEDEDLCQDGRCVNTDGSYFCLCNPGFIQSQDKKYCIDGRQGLCYTERTPQGYCRNSLHMRLSKKDCCCGLNMGQGWGDDCSPCPQYGEDEHRQLCATPIHHVPGGPGSTEVIYQPGSEIPSSQKKVDMFTVNECILRPDICGKGRCVDTLEAYECLCDSGFRPGLNKACEDIDECREGKCQNGRCINTPGSFICQCAPGFDISPDGTLCTDMDECAKIGMCTNGICINMDGSFKCSCKTGFKLSPTGYACVDIDECDENSRICLNGRCENTQGSYTCSCFPGFVESNDRTFCSDLDECTTTGMCDHGRCINMEGSFRCVCDSGYRLGPDGKHCVDIDECISNPCQFGTCYNTPGSFRCECFSGFSLGPDGRSCLDTRRDLCYQEYRDGLCFNPSTTAVTKSSCCCCTVVTGKPMGWGTSCQPCPMPGSTDFDLLCPHGPGSTFDGNDINECAQNPNICQNGACENMIGTYRCICNPGFEVDETGKICTDINECEIEELICSGGQCRNTLGSFQCICPPGTQLNQQNFMCEDVDECRELGPEACFNGECVNTLGSYKCDCDPGSVLDSTGRICIDNRKGFCWTKLNQGRCENNLPIPSRRQECCCSIGVAWGSPCGKCDRSECDCPKGYAKANGKTCEDINECDLNPDICGSGGICVNTEGSFTCTCPPGLTLDETRTHCLDIRQEQCFTRYKHGKCTNPIDGLFHRDLCCCSSIGKAWGERCEQCPRPGTPAFQKLCPKGTGYLDRKDINECIEFPGMCQNGRCKNTIGGYSCRCNKGYDYDDSRIKCIDIDECSITTSNVCGNGVCRNIPGDFTCECNEGFRTMAPMQICMDINECEETPGLCRGGRCNNTEGSFNCICPPGHELAPDKQSCKDIDECSRTSGICSNGVCENMMGTYQCICNEGYQQTGLKTHCEDIDECDLEPCDDICTNTPGSFSCSCGPGYALNLDGRTCQDIDECKENPRICNGGKCTNSIGSYICHCTEGLVAGRDGTSCIDIDECRQNPHICGNGECINTLGSYQCRCEEGYSVKPDGRDSKCTDDDECYLQTANCHEYANCLNRPGSYQCVCQDGFTGNGISCRDVDECVTNNGGCDQNARCLNNDGSFKCECDAGFKGDGYTCEDIDECSNDPSLCENGQCLNYPGSFRCECEMGFMHPEEGNQQACVDINECDMFNNLCVFGKCENTFGMFRCECRDGYKLDGTGGNCTDIDECESPQSCLYGTCSNIQGSFKCLCPPNYELVAEGNACIDRRTSRCYLHVDEYGRCEEPSADYVTKAACCCSVGKAWGPQCDHCPPQDSKEYEILCPGGMGYKPNDLTVVLEDINECEEHENICHNGYCTNTFGSFMCSCNEGFRLDETGFMCVDINECQESPDICNVGECINEPGNYYCQCPEGYMPLHNRKECVDMRKDLCFLDYNAWRCSTPMTQNTTKKLCCCSMGQAWGQPCEPCPIPGTSEHVRLCGARPGQIINPITNETQEINECEMMSTMCKHGQCINTPGSFECHCNRGYIYDAQSHQCIDDNECVRNPCEGNAQCINLQGSFECKCPEGYKHGQTMVDCVDINECHERPNICQNGECKNLQGSFQCVCNTGYYLSPSREDCVDIDECTRQPNICNNGTCINIPGTYKCHCNNGFKLSNNNDCEDVDECRMMPFLCRNGRCRNNIGSFSCECHKGYTLAIDRHNCRDIDECQEKSVCPPPGKCTNVMGSYVCTCPEGYQLSPDTGYCEDIDECIMNPDICEFGECSNVEGGAFCTCPDGFILDKNSMKCVDVRKEMCYDDFSRGQCQAPRGMQMTIKECCCSKAAAWGRYCERCPPMNSEEFQKLCPEGPGREDSGTDLNECELMPNVCDGGECVNTDGSFRCDCPMGYVLDESKMKCVDDNECYSNPGICGNGTCTNVQGGFECSCNDGFAPGPMQICEDVNECHEIGNQCAFRCHNVPGSFRCICPYGYALAPDGRHCQDVNECATPANNCKFMCKNLIGSFMCICPEGYVQIPLTDDCRDIDECAANEDLCHNGRCVNLQGSYRCDCYDGFEPSPDGKRCVDRRLDLCFRTLVHGRCANYHNQLKQVTRADCCCSMGEAWGRNCEICPPKFSPQYQELCLESGFLVTGEDVNECETIPDLCKNGQCINTMGSYRCICNKGYKPDHSGLYCLDVNECEHSPCQYNCQNTEGSFICSCPAGFLLNPDGQTCRDLDECATGQHLCQQNCINTQGSYSCSCDKGYNQIGDKCQDIDECKEDPGLCPKPGTCFNTLGSFRCICPRGFKLDVTGTYCLDADECEDDSKCVEGCQNIVGGYKCGCPDGFVLHPYYNKCVDDDECANNPCGGSVQCFNTLGGYRCGCAAGYQFDNRINDCMQMSHGCMNSPCAYGCIPNGPTGFSCGCPRGYKAFEQGHCVTTITPAGNYGDDIGDVPVYPINDRFIGGASSASNDKLITTEGCFSCKINGRHRRDSRSGKLKQSDRQDMLEHLFSITPEERRQRHKRHHHAEHIDLTIKMSQTRHRTRIIKIQPSVKREMIYMIVKGNENNKFELKKSHGVWALHFRRRLKHPEVFDLMIHGRPIDTSSDDEEKYEKPLTLSVRITVVE